MRKITWIWLVVTGFSVPFAEAQEAPKWEVAGSAALFAARPFDEFSPYQDNWYSDGRYAVAIGHYWTEHLKTEVEYAIAGEGVTFRQEFKPQPGFPAGYPYSVETFHRLEQASVRMVWQFRENAWVHPYVSGGIVGDRERQRLRVPAQYQYVSGRANEPIVAVREVNSDPTWEYRVGFTAGAGVKFYMTPNAFFNTGVIGTYSKPSATFGFLAGFGMEF